MGQNWFGIARLGTPLQQTAVQRGPLSRWPQLSRVAWARKNVSVFEVINRRCPATLQVRASFVRTFISCSRIKVSRQVIEDLNHVISCRMAVEQIDEPRVLVTSKPERKQLENRITILETKVVTLKDGPMPQVSPGWLLVVLTLR